MNTALDVALARSEALESIPPITDPMGRNWNQPARKEILIDDTHALMTGHTFDRLATYSTTYPTGVYEGKMWKRHNGAYDREFLGRGGKPVWCLCWYSKSDDPRLVYTNLREILIVDDGFAPTQLSNHTEDASASDSKEREA